VQLSTDVLKRMVLDLITTGFPDAHAFTQLPGSPAGYGSPFRKRECKLPGRPGPVTTEPPRSVRFTCFEALLPLRVRSRWIGLPLPTGRCSPGFSPL